MNGKPLRGKQAAAFGGDDTPTGLEVVWQVTERPLRRGMNGRDDSVRGSGWPGRIPDTKHCPKLMRSRTPIAAIIDGRVVGNLGLPLRRQGLLVTAQPLVLLRACCVRGAARLALRTPGKPGERWGGMRTKLPEPMTPEEMADFCMALADRAKQGIACMDYYVGGMIDAPDPDALAEIAVWIRGVSRTAPAGAERES